MSSDLKALDRQISELAKASDFSVDLATAAEDLGTTENDFATVQRDVVTHQCLAAASNAAVIHGDASLLDGGARAVAARATAVNSLISRLRTQIATLESQYQTVASATKDPAIQSAGAERDSAIAMIAKTNDRISSVHTLELRARTTIGPLVASARHLSDEAGVLAKSCR
jgi:hypothetical protein